MWETMCHACTVLTFLCPILCPVFLLCPFLLADDFDRDGVIDRHGALAASG